MEILCMNMENLQLRPTETCPRSVKTIVVKSTVNGIYWDHINLVNLLIFVLVPIQGPRFTSAYIMIFFFWFNDLRWEVVIFVGIGWPSAVWTLFKMIMNNDGQQFHQYQQMRNHLSPQTIEHKKNHDIWHWKSRSWIGRGTKMLRVKPVNVIPTLPLWNIFFNHYITVIDFSSGPVAHGQWKLIRTSDFCQIFSIQSI